MERSNPSFILTTVREEEEEPNPEYQTKFGIDKLTLNKDSVYLNY
jgi:hypothetical protein